MTKPNNEKGRPGQGDRSRNSNTNKAIVIPAGDVTAYVEAGFVLVVATTNVLKGCTRRRVYFNLPSASAAVARAHRNGNVARIVLAKLIPVGDAQ